jgi:hypothetical protein
VQLKRLALPAAVVSLVFGSSGWSFHTDHFEPEHRLSGIGAGRTDMSALVLEARTQRMIDSQTFIIMREPEALAGAERICSPKLQKLFKSAGEQSGFPASTLAAISYIESFGNAKAQSPSGPVGIMQFSEATARSAGLRVIRKTRYRTVTSKQTVRNKRGRMVTRKVRTRIPYTVTIRDERLIPERAIPAAANYLARLAARYGRQDWAVFAYHCGEGCVAELQPLTEKVVKDNEPVSVASMFFSASPAHNRDLYEALQFHMQRDYSPTYWFRIMRAEQLLKMYQDDPSEFKQLWADYRNDANPQRRADHRLVVWLKGADLLYRSCDDLRRAEGKELVRVFNNPDYYGFTFRPGDPPNLSADDQALYAQASPSTIGTLVYIAYETRRLFEAVNPKDEKFVPLDVAELVSTTDQDHRREPGTNVPVHCTGQVFDLSTAKLGPAERECLNFILDEMGWDGYLGFMQESGDLIHIGCSPSSREFFAQVYQDALAANT